MADSKPAALGSAAASVFLDASERVQPHTKLIALLAVGHFVIDVTQGSLAAVLPFLRQTHALSYAQVAMVSVVLGHSYLPRNAGMAPAPRDATA